MKAYLFIWPWSGQRRGSSGPENRRALRNNDKEISLDYKRPQMNACKESHNSNMNNNFLLDNENAKVVNKKSCE